MGGGVPQEAASNLGCMLASKSKSRRLNFITIVVTVVLFLFCYTRLNAIFFFLNFFYRVHACIDPREHESQRTVPWHACSGQGTVSGASLSLLDYLKQGLLFSVVSDRLPDSEASLVSLGPPQGPRDYKCTLLHLELRECLESELGFLPLSGKCLTHKASSLSLLKVQNMLSVCLPVLNMLPSAPINYIVPAFDSAVTSSAHV